MIWERDCADDLAIKKPHLAYQYAKSDLSHLNKKKISDKVKKAEKKSYKHVRLNYLPAYIFIDKVLKFKW